MLGGRIHGSWLVVIVLGIASPVSACPVCWGGRDGTTSAYLLTAVLMCAALLVIFGGLAYYVFRQTTQDGATAQERASQT